MLTYTLKKVLSKNTSKFEDDFMMREVMDGVLVNDTIENYITC